MAEESLGSHGERGEPTSAIFEHTEPAEKKEAARRKEEKERGSKLGP